METLDTEFHIVTDIQSPAILVLDGTLTVRLLGIRPRPEAVPLALRLLKELTKDSKVFYKQDKVTSDVEGIPLVYLYGNTGLFMNAMLVKYDLVDVDDSIAFRYLPRFLKKQTDNRRKED